MADIKNEIDSLAAYVESKLVGIECINHMPSNYEINRAVIRFISSGSVLETSYHYRIDRTFQIVYFGKTELDCLTKMNELERHMNNDQVIPLIGTSQETRYLRIGSFSLSQAFKTEGGVFAIVGVLNASLRETRPEDQSEKINHVNATIKE